VGAGTENGAERAQKSGEREWDLKNTVEREPGGAGAEQWAGLRKEV